MSQLTQVNILFFYFLYLCKKCFLLFQWGQLTPLNDTQPCPWAYPFKINPTHKIYPTRIKINPTQIEINPKIKSTRPYSSLFSLYFCILIRICSERIQMEECCLSLVFASVTLHLGGQIMDDSCLDFQTLNLESYFMPFNLNGNQLTFLSCDSYGCASLDFMSTL